MDVVPPKSGKKKADKSKSEPKAGAQKLTKKTKNTKNSVTFGTPAKKASESESTKPTPSGKLGKKRRKKSNSMMKDVLGDAVNNVQDAGATLDVDTKNNIQDDDNTSVKCKD